MVQVSTGVLVSLLALGVTLFLAVISVLYKIASNIGTLAENVSHGNEKISNDIRHLDENLTANMESVDNNLDSIKNDLRRMSETIDRIEGRLDGYFNHSPETDGGFETNLDREFADVLPEDYTKYPTETEESISGESINIVKDYKITSDFEKIWQIELIFSPKSNCITEGVINRLRDITDEYIKIELERTETSYTITATFGDGNKKEAENWLSKSLEFLRTITKRGGSTE